MRFRDLVGGSCWSGALDCAVLRQNMRKAAIHGWLSIARTTENLHPQWGSGMLSLAELAGLTSQLVGLKKQAGTGGCWA